jgi:hypothetical protein
MSEQHAKPPRGLMSTKKSPKAEGSFGRMFGCLQPAKYGKDDNDSRANLMKLGELMTAKFEEPEDRPDPEESGIPALYTYLGQFIAHDIAFDPMSTLMKQADPDALTDFRTPALDLDSIYGRGPDDQPYMYEGRKFLLGKKLSGGSDPRAQDLARNTGGRALIGDPRNDENVIISQLHSLFLRFHNRTIDDHDGIDARTDFDKIQQIVRFHYQYVILNDFLPRIVHASVIKALKNDEGFFDRDKLKFFHWKKQPFMPVEFSVAAYRLGHSMIRPGYRLNDNVRLPIFGSSRALTGFSPVDPTSGIDWGRFIDIDTRSYGSYKRPADVPTQKRLQFAYRVDTSLVKPLSDLPSSVVSDPPSSSLPQRNLIRSFALNLPSGQDVAAAMKETPLKDKEILIGKAVDSPEKGDVKGTIDSIPDLKVFRKNCPLWTYILAEAATNKEMETIPVTEEKQISTPRLGPVGGRIVAEVFLGLLFGDENSFLNVDPKWHPKSGTNYKLKDFVKYALGAKC